MKYENQFKQEIETQFIELAQSNAQNIYIEFELTGKCRNNCFFCGNFSQPNPSEIDFKLLKKFIKKVSSYYRGKQLQPIFSLCGGDPLLYSHFEELLYFLDKMNLLFVLKTNPSTLTEDAAYLLDLHGCKGVKFTFLGDEKLHNETRGNETFDDLKEKTAMLQQLEMPVFWNLTVGSFNLESIIENLPKIREAQPDGIMVGRMAHIGKLKEATDYREISAQEFRSFLVHLLNYYSEHYKSGFHLAFKEKLWVPLLGELGLLNLEELNIPPGHIGCDAYCRTLNINSSSEIILCGLLSSYQPSLLKDFNKDTLSNLPTLSAKHNTSCHSCKYEAYCQGCRAIAHANTGDIYGKDPQCWL
ncbi:MAG: radical SAM protein [Leptospirales bacterium]